MLVAVSSFLYGDLLLVNSETWRDLCSLLATLFATLLGFVVTALSILTAVPDKKLIGNLKRSGHYQHLISELFWTATAMFFGLVAAVVFLFGPVICQQYTFAFLAFVFSIALYLFGSSGYKFYLVMEFMHRDAESN